MKNKRLRRLVDFASCRLHHSFKDAATCEVFLRVYIEGLRKGGKAYVEKCQKLVEMLDMYTDRIDKLQTEVDMGLTRTEELEEENRKLVRANTTVSTKMKKLIEANVSLQRRNAVLRKLRIDDREGT